MTSSPRASSAARSLVPIRPLAPVIVTRMLGLRASVRVGWRGSTSLIVSATLLASAVFSSRADSVAGDGAGPRPAASRVGRRARHDHVDPRHDDRQRRDRDARAGPGRVADVDPVGVHGLSARAGDRDPADRLGDGALQRAKVWMVSVALFLLGSGLCGLAWSIESLIVFRVLQGFGGGMIMPVGQAILAQAAGPQRMGRVMSVIGVPTLLGPILGPVIGGLIVDHFSWRWIFFVNLPGRCCRSGARVPDPAAGRADGQRTARPARAAASLARVGVAGLRALGGGDRRDGARPARADRPARRSGADGGVRVLVAARGRDARRPDAVPRPRLRGRVRHDVHLRRVPVRRDADPAALLPGRAGGERALGRSAAGAAGNRSGHRDADRGPAHRQARRGADRALRRADRPGRHARLHPALGRPRASRCWPSRCSSAASGSA